MENGVFRINDIENDREEIENSFLPEPCRLKCTSELSLAALLLHPLYKGLFHSILKNKGGKKRREKEKKRKEEERRKEEKRKEKKRKEKKRRDRENKREERKERKEEEERREEERRGEGKK